MERLYESLDERPRPEDAAQLVLDLLGDRLNRRERRVLAGKVAAAHRGIAPWAETSMSRDFARPVGAQTQKTVANRLFSDSLIDPDSPEGIATFIEAASTEIAKAPGASDFLADRLNREERREAGLGDMSRRQYNKRFRFLARLERKERRLEREIMRRRFTQVSKAGLAARIPADEFFADEPSACFVAYYAARSNMRSVFTNTRQEKPFDEVAAVLLNHASRGDANWWVIAHVYPDKDVLARLDDGRKGELLGVWLEELRLLAGFMEEVWNTNTFEIATMIVKKGDDSSTWNALAGAWNRARAHWIALLYSLGLQNLLQDMCPGKTLRLMAADVAAWHRASGGDLEDDTTVFSQLPFPWQVLKGDAQCTSEMVERVCRDAGVDPIEKGWIAPRPKGAPAPVRPTPELVHGVVVQSPHLASTLRRAGWFSGYEDRLRDLPDGTVVFRSDVGPLPERSQVQRPELN